MSKNIIFNSIPDATINTLSDYTVNMVNAEILRKETRATIKKLEEEKDEIIAEMNKALDSGTLSFDEAKDKFSTTAITNEINKLNNQLKEDLKPYNATKRKLLKALNVSNLWDAYFVGVSKMDFSATGTVNKITNKRDGSYNVKPVTATTSFTTQLGQWLEELGFQNADNEGAVRRFTKNYFVPMISTANRLDKLNATISAGNKSAFGDVLLVTLKEILIKYNVLVEDTTDGNYKLTRKSEESEEEANA